MKSLSLFALASIVTLTSTAFADLEKILPPGAEVKKLVGGCRFTEGPAWSPAGHLLFSDIPNSRIVKLLAGGATSDFLNPSGRANGLMFDAAGRLYACQGGDRRLVRIDPATKAITVIADSFGGKKLNSPNDVALDTYGGVYFTDPRYGKVDGTEQLRADGSPLMAVYHVDAAGKLSRVIDDLQRPNGILVSPDGKLLYVAEPDRRQIYRYDISGPGKIGGKKLIYVGDRDADGGGPDGMAHDSLGNIYATYKGIVVLDPQGRLLGRIAVPEHPANCTFGGKDGRTLFITARTSVYSVDLAVTGAPARPAPGGAVPTRDEKVGVLTMKIPASWKRGKPSSRMRLAQFVVPAVKGDSEDAELVVYYFGRNQGGGVAANVQRWVGQFDAKDRKVQIFGGKVKTGDYALVDATGTYNKPIGPPIAGRKKPTPGSRMLAVILPSGEGDYFLKFTGPAKTVSAAAGPFRGAFGADPSKEKRLER